MHKEFRIILYKSILLFFIIIILLSGANFFYKKYIIVNTFTFRKEQDFQAYVDGLVDKKIDYLFLGSSHTLNGINPKYIPNSYNFGNSGLTSIEEYLILKKILEKDKLKIENIIVEVDPHMFWQRFEDGQYLFRDFWYYSQLTSIDEFTKINHDSFTKLFIKKTFPVIGDSIKFGILINKPKLKDLFFGWNKKNNIFDLSYNEESDYYKILAKNVESSSGLSDKRQDYFLKIIELAKENNIKVTLLKYPHHNFYERTIQDAKSDFHVYYDPFINKIDEVLGKNNYKFLDYYTLYFENGNYFDNPDHLNYIGAENLAKKVYQAIK